jgi:hypothetical protein
LGRGRFQAVDFLQNGIGAAPEQSCGDARAELARIVAGL